MLVGEAIGFGAAMALGRGVVAIVGEPGELLTLALACAAGAVEGACLGAAQGLVLRRVWPGLRVGAWARATMVGGALAWALGMTAGGHGPGTMPPLWVIGLVMIASGLVLGGILGAAQAVVVRRHARGAGRWIAANAVGWMIGLMFAYAGIALTPEPGASAYDVAVMAACGAAMAIAPALLTGRALRGLTPRG